MLVSPESVYGPAWSTAATVVDQVAAVVREPADWRAPGREGEAVRALESEGGTTLIHHHEAFFNGSLIWPGFSAQTAAPWGGCTRLS